MEMMNIFYPLQRIINIGITKQLAFSERKRVRIINGILCFILMVKSLFAVSFLTEGTLWAVAMQLSVISVLVIIFLLNHTHRYSLATHLFIITLLFDFFMNSIATGPEAFTQYYFFGAFVGTFIFFSRFRDQLIYSLVTVTCFMVLQVSYNYIDPLVPFSTFFYYLDILFLFGGIFIVLNFFRYQHEEYQQIIEDERDRKEQLLQRVEEEMETGRQIVTRLLPEHMPSLPGYTLHASLQLMQRIGGDFYDYTVDESGYMHLMIADVSGHGLASAFIALITKMGLDTISSNESPADVLRQVNEVVMRSTVRNYFVTAFYCSIYQKTGKMRYCSAGHPPPVLYSRSSGQIVELNTRGRALGIFKELALEENEITIHPGDRLILYTDGITECSSPGGQLFGDDRLLSLVQEHAHEKADIFAKALLSTLHGFSGKSSFDDDITVMVLDRK